VPLILDALAPQEIEVSCADAHSEDVVRLLDDGAADVGIVVPCPHPRSITVERFGSDPVICVAHPEHDLAGRGGLRVRDLATFAVACTAWGDRAVKFLELLRAAPIPSSGLHSVSPAETVANLARRGSHVGMLPRSTVRHDLASGGLVEVSVLDLPRWGLILGLAYRVVDSQTEPVRALRAALLAGSSLSEQTALPALRGRQP
jgi:DNA-binding transcriptional LysR family regulator